MKNWALLIAALGLGACSSAPHPILLSPSVPVSQQKINAFSPINIQVIDQRKANYLVEINGSDAEKRLLAPAVPPRTLLQKALIAGFNRANVSVTEQAPVTLDFYLDQLLVKVEQSTFDYDAKTSLILKVKGDSNKHTFSKDYKVNGTMNGAFKLDNATIEQELNRLIDKLTTDIINDRQLHQFLSKK